MMDLGQEVLRLSQEPFGETWATEASLSSLANQEYTVHGYIGS